MIGDPAKPRAQRPLRVALLTTDNREHYKKYSATHPFFGSAPEALLEGFKEMPDEVVIDIVSCLQREVSPQSMQLAPNIRYHALHVPKAGWMRTGYQGCIRAVRRKLRELQPDVVHGQGTERDCAVCAVVSGYPNVLTLHGNIGKVAEQICAKPFSYYWLAARLEKWCLKRTDGVVAISSYTASNVAPFAKRTWLVHNAVHPDFFGMARHEAAKPRLLCVAHVSPWKNQNGLIEALDPLRKEMDFDLVFAGSAEAKDAYAAQFLSMVRQRDWCHHAGSLGRASLMEELSSATAVVLPSFEDNCPMVVLEAAAAGVPVAASAIGGIPDLIDDEKTGLLFDPRDGKSIACAVRKILTSRPAASAMAAAAGMKCREQNSGRNVARRHIGIYGEVTSLGRKQKNS